MDEGAIAAALQRAPGWQRAGDVIRRRFELRDFAEALVFVNRVGALAEAAGHHPDIDIRYNAVTLALTTHDAGGLTAKDFDLARAVSMEMGDATWPPSPSTRDAPA
ncbi:MAG TPA: 4a-hydroxytetrahydrobiopterin dehydratase [Methylomirabilota bacterium]|nr:4a-hydroxytetrahydrobiopterin dehydratase [Methylomirabilota bacterium]